jgi:hypothetical protein
MKSHAAALRLFPDGDSPDDGFCPVAGARDSLSRRVLPAGIGDKRTK